MPIKLQKLPAAVRWGLAVLCCAPPCAACCGPITGGCSLGWITVCPPWWLHWGVRPFWKYVCWPGIVCGGLQKDLRQKGAVCIFLCGLLFAFANPPLQTPDEADHYLRTYAISTGHFDFDASRTYPDDVAYLLEAFPGAWVNAHTSAGGH